MSTAQQHAVQDRLAGKVRGQPVRITGILLALQQLCGSCSDHRCSQHMCSQKTSLCPMAGAVIWHMSGRVG